MRARRVILANYHKGKKRGIGIMSTHLVGEPRLRRGNFNQGVSSVKTK